MSHWSNYAFGQLLLWRHELRAKGCSQDAADLLEWQLRLMLAKERA